MLWNVLFTRNNAKDVQFLRLLPLESLCNRIMASKFVHDAISILHLVELLDPTQDNDITSQIVLILSKMAKNQQSCLEMLKANAIPRLGHLLSQCISDETLILVMQTLGKCPQHLSRGFTFHKLFPPDVLPPLLRLLDPGHM